MNDKIKYVYWFNLINHKKYSINYVQYSEKFKFKFFTVSIFKFNKLKNYN